MRTLLFGFAFVVIVGVTADIQYSRGFEAGKVQTRQELAEAAPNPLPSGNGYIDSVCMGWLYGSE